MEKEKCRNSNFELMRIISMIFIILWHIIMHGNLITNCTNKSIILILELLQYGIIVHVNSFVLLSGYFQSKSNFKLSKFLALIFQVIFYSTLILIVSIKLGFIQNYSVSTFLNNLSLTSVNNYWFIKMYIVVYLLSNMINKFINSLDRKSYKNVLIVLFIIFSILMFLTGGRFFENNGYNFYNFIFLYMIGGYFRKYSIKETYYFKRMSINGYRCFLIFIFTILMFLNFSINKIAVDINSYGGFFKDVSNVILYSKLAYSSPFVMVQSVCYFLLFETLNIKSKVINFLSSCTFGIYLFHDNNFVRNIIYKLFLIDSGKFSGYNIFLGIFITIVYIFIIGVLIEIIRKFIFWLLLKCKIIQSIINKFKEFINSFNFKINW